MNKESKGQVLPLEGDLRTQEGVEMQSAREQKTIAISMKTNVNNNMDDD